MVTYKSNVRKRGKGLLKEMIRFDVGKIFYINVCGTDSTDNL